MAAQKQRGRDELVLVPLGGAGEIGMNVYLYGYGPAAARQWLMVDLGITFPQADEPGVDVVLPDLRFIEENRKNLLGIVLTHAHEDHFGAVMDMWPRLKVPIYATQFTAALLKAKLAEEKPGEKLPLTILDRKARLRLGPFDIELINVAHSIPESNALAIRTPLGLVVHTADWKTDPDPITDPPTDEARLRQLGDEGVLAVVGDSTNALREGVSPSEVAVGETLLAHIRKAKQAVAVTTFASNVARIRSVADAARKTGRELVVCGRAMHRILQVAQESGHIPPGFKYHDQQAFGDIRPENVLALCTGSQGEPRAALARIAAGEHPEVTLRRGDTVIFSSRTIPGNEKPVGRVHNGLADQGVRIIADTDPPVHVTGHPRREELRQLYAWTRPRCAIPMHGEPRHLEEHAELARACGVKHTVRMRNGTLIRLAPEPCEVVDDVPVGRLYRDGRIIVAAEAGPVGERRKLSFAGIAVVSVVLSKSRELLVDPDVVIDGIPRQSAAGDDMEDLILDALEGAFESIPKARRKDLDLVRDALHRAVRAAVNSAWGKKPVCKVLLSVVD